MNSKARRGFTAAMTAVAVIACISGRDAMGQALPSYPQRTLKSADAVSLAHLYWHFLSYQHHLDIKAAALATQGKDSHEMKNHLQRKLGFSDAAYAPIRVSSNRLSSEIQGLDDQAVALRSGVLSPDKHEKLQALNVHREVYIVSEISYLKQNLSSEQIKTFETFLAQLFSPPDPRILTGLPPIHANTIPSQPVQK